MTKKRQTRLGTTESFSSEEMEPSKPPKGVLELGRHLVRELGLHDGGDTIGRWMAHHLAELIDTAENATTSEERIRAEERATETILKIWEHRTSLPRKAYPLAPYKDILQILNRLRPDDNPFKYFGNSPEARREQLAANLFDNLTHLVIALLLMRMPSDVKCDETDAAAVDALNETEQQVLRSLQHWIELFPATNKKAVRTRKSKKFSESPQIILDKVAVQLIDNIATTLAELRTQLQIASSDEEVADTLGP